MRTVVICHHDAALDREGLVRWLASFTTLVGVVIVREAPGRLRQRISREISRVGWLRFLDVLAYRIFHRVRFAGRDRAWEQDTLRRMRPVYAAFPCGVELNVTSPNSSEAERFIRDAQPDLVIARCKTILRPAIFSIPRLGTFVMHPGICPEYRNAHGGFWAMASDDFDNVGMTLLRVDQGIDTGPVYGYFRVQPRPGESHVIIQNRSVFDHLDAIRDTLLAIEAGHAPVIPTDGRRSAAWGQPWLTAYARIRRAWTAREHAVRPAPLKPGGLA